MFLSVLVNVNCLAGTQCGLGFGAVGFLAPIGDCLADCLAIVWRLLAINGSGVASILVAVTSGVVRSLPVA